MTIFQADAGTLEPLRVILADTANTSVLTADEGERIAIAKIRVTNVTGSAVTVDIEINHASTAFYVEKAKSVPANSSIEIYDEFLGSGDILKMKAGTGSSSLHVHVHHSLPDPSK